GTHLVFSTYFGGSGADITFGFAIDPSGAAYVTGLTQSPNLPTTAGAFQRSPSNRYGEAFVAKLDPSGNRFDYATYLGGNGYDEAVDNAVDRTGHAYVTGISRSTDFPTTLGALQRTASGGNGDAFVTKLDPSGARLSYSTYLGGSRFEQGNGIAVDDQGDAYITGTTSSRDFPVTRNAPQSALRGDRNVFVTKLAPSGSRVLYSTYLGGS